MSKFYSSFPLLPAIILFACQSASAQKSDTTITKQLNEVIVTADKGNTKLSETGKSVIVISQDQLQKSGGKSLSQILNEQPGIIVNGAGSNPGALKTIYMDGASGGYVLILLDGVPVQDASSVDNSFDIRMLTLESIERIEIVKGSQSVLYGSDAIAGVINIITKKGAGKPFTASANGSYGTNNTIQAGASVGGTLQKISYNAGYAYYHTDGISEATDTVTAPHPAAPRDGYTQHSLHAGLTWQAAKGVSLSPFIFYSHYNGRDDVGSFDIDPNSTYTLRNLQTGLRTLWNIGKGQLHANYSYNRTDRADLDDSVPTLAAKGSYSSDALTGYEHYVDAYLSYPISSSVNVIGGADYRNLSTEQNSLYLYPDYTNPTQVDTSASSLSRSNAHYNQVGVYGATTIQLPLGFYVDGGLRYNTNSKYGSSLVFNFDPSYTISHALKAFVNVSSGYKTPSLYQLYSAYGNKNLQPEKAMTYEGGLQYTTPSGAFRIRGTYFKRHIEDVIFFFTNPTTYQSQYINLNKENDRGLKLEAEWKVTQDLSVKSNYTYATGNVTTQAADGKLDSTYYGLIRVPKNSAGLTVGYQITKDLFVSSNVQWQDKRLDLYYDANTYEDATIDLHAFTLWNAYAEYQLRHHHIKLFVIALYMTITFYMEVYGYNTLGFTFTGGILLKL